MQAFAGIMSVTGEEGQAPVRAGVSIVDFGAGMWAVIGILAALCRRQRKHVGATVNSSLLETAIAWMTVALPTTTPTATRAAGMARASASSCRTARSTRPMAIW